MTVVGAGDNVGDNVGDSTGDDVGNDGNDVGNVGILRVHVAPLSNVNVSAISPVEDTDAIALYLRSSGK